MMMVWLLLLAFSSLSAMEIEESDINNEISNNSSSYEQACIAFNAARILEGIKKDLSGANIVLENNLIKISVNEQEMFLDITKEDELPFSMDTALPVFARFLSTMPKYKNKNIRLRIYNKEKTTLELFELYKGDFLSVAVKPAGQ